MLENNWDCCQSFYFHSLLLQLLISGADLSLELWQTLLYFIDFQSFPVNHLPFYPSLFNLVSHIAILQCDKESQVNHDYGGRSHIWTINLNCCSIKCEQRSHICLHVPSPYLFDKQFCEYLFTGFLPVKTSLLLNNHCTVTFISYLALPHSMLIHYSPPFQTPWGTCFEKASNLCCALLYLKPELTPLLLVLWAAVLENLADR